jgi:hypothetical protein
VYLDYKYNYVTSSLFITSDEVSEEVPCSRESSPLNHKIISIAVGIYSFQEASPHFL